MTRDEATEAIDELTAEERDNLAAELLAAAVDAIETYEAGGAMGNPIMRLRESVRKVKADPDWTGRP